MGHKKSKGVELRLAQLEDAFGCGCDSGAVPGTTLSRALLSKEQGGGIGWCLGIGRLAERKHFFYAKNVDGCIREAWNALLRREARSKILEQLLQPNESLTL